MQLELITYYPKEHDVDITNGGRNKIAFSIACEATFPVGRVFCSFLQINQVLKLFLEQWAVTKSSQGKTITCAYGQKQIYKKSKYQKKTATNDDFLKEHNCLFQVKYSYVSLLRDKQKLLTFYRVKITQLETKHTCQQSSISHRNALQSGGHLVKIDIDKIRVVADMID